MDKEQEDKVASLLAKAGLSHLCPAFLREKVTVELIPLLQQSDLEKLGVVHVGERVILLSLAKAHEREAKVGTELRGLFGHGQSSSEGSHSSQQPTTSSESLLARASRLCKQLRPGKSIHSRRKGSKPYQRTPVSKEVQKGLILVDFQGEKPSEVLPLREYEKIYDGCIRYRSDMPEDEIRDEIVRLVRQKESDLHDLNCLMPSDFDFVRCANRRVKSIDGDAPFDANGISQIYRNGAIYVRLNNQLLLKDNVLSADAKSSPVASPSSVLPNVSFAIQQQHSSITSPPVISEQTAATQPILVDTDDSGDELLQTALALSKETAANEASVRALTCSHVDETVPCTLADVVRKLRKVVKNDKPPFDMVVRRAHVLEDALRRANRSSFDPSRRIVVEFLGEQGSDTGGLTREFFRLVGYHATKYLEPSGCFKHNSVALQDGVYFRLGQLIAMALLHGGAGVRILSPSVFNFLSGMKPSDIIVGIDEIADTDVKVILKKIQSVDDPDELRSVIGENFDLISECGFTKPTTKLTMDDKVTLVQSVALHQVILRTLGELSQFRDGLDTLGVARAMEQYGVLLQEFFVNKKSGVTADGIRKIFKTVRFSEEGSNAREKEQNSYMMFLDYLDECEKVNLKIDINEIKECEEDEEPGAVGSSRGSCDVSLEMVMVFFSGADAIPPMGYPHEPLINFNPESPFPTASTCALQLTLPTCYTDYGPFKHALNTAFTMHGGFGMS